MTVFLKKYETFSTGLFLFFTTSILFVACSKKREIPLFTLEKETGINFTNNVVDGELENSFFYRNYYNGGGVAMGDINNDGLSDVLLTSNQGENKLYLNKGNFKFEDITVKAACSRIVCGVQVW